MSSGYNNHTWMLFRIVENVKFIPIQIIKLIEIALALLLYDNDFKGYIMTRYLSKVIDISVRHVIKTVTFNL